MFESTQSNDEEKAIQGGEVEKKEIENKKQ